MDPREEILLLRAIERARDSGDIDTETKVMREWEAATQRYQNQSALPSASESALINIGHGMVKMGEGANQMMLRADEAFGAIPDGTASQYTQDALARQQEFENSPVGRGAWADTMQALGGGAAAAIFPAGKAAEAAAAGGTIGAIDFKRPGESGVAPTVVGAATGYGGAKAFDFIEEASKAAIGKIQRKMSGDLAPEAKETIDLGVAHDVPVYGMDTSDAPGVERLSSWMDRLPLVGTMGPRMAQRAKQRQAADEVLSDFGSVEDVGDEIQSSLRSYFGKVRQNKTALYKKVDAAAGNAVVPTSNMQAAAKKMIDEQLSRPEAYQDKALVARLERFLESPEGTFKDLSLLRSELGDEIKDIGAGKGAVASSRVKTALGNVKQALEADMSAFAQSAGNPRLSAAWAKADKFYRTKYAPLKFSKQLQNAMETETPDQILESFVKVSAGLNKQGDKSKVLYRALDRKGRQAVRYAVVARAWEKATRPEQPDFFNPSTFARTIENQAKQIDVFFTPAQKQQVLGLGRLLKRTAWHGDINPPTGARLQDLPLAGAAYGIGAGHAPVVAIGGAAAWSIKALLTSQFGRALLTRAGTSNQTPAQLNFLAKQAGNLIRRIGTSTGVVGATDAQEQ